MDFSGKNRMLRYIVSSYEKKGSGLLILYGEAGLGKTSLLIEILSKYEYAFYYQAVPASERQQAAFLCKAMFPEREFPARNLSYEEIFRTYAFETKQKRILMFDEFEHMIRGGDQFMEQITRLMNQDYTEQEFLVVLCSSSLGFIANSMGRRLGKAAAWIQGLLKMKEYSYSDIRSLCSKESPQVTFYRYAIMGGRPAAIMNSLSCHTLKEMILRMYLDREGIFYDYGIRYISDNLREPNVYATILYMIAQGHYKLNDLYHETGFSRAKISVYLKNLIELDLVEKVYSYGASPRDDSQKGIYRISNPIIHFWYRFVYAYRNRLEFMDPEQFYHSFIEAELDAYLEFYYGRIISQLLCENRIRGIVPVRKCEEWVGKSGNIPIIAFAKQEPEPKHTTAGADSMLIAFTKHAGGPVTAQDLERYCFYIRKTGFSCRNMLIFSEKKADPSWDVKAGRMNVRILSVFGNIVE